MQSSQRDERDESDVVIVGAGPSAAVAAKRLIDSGYSVVCLEQGSWPDYSRARTSKPEHVINYGLECE
jgi:flavin-dependent dehydrogenase